MEKQYIINVLKIQEIKIKNEIMFSKSEKSKQLQIELELIKRSIEKIEREL